MGNPKNEKNQKKKQKKHPKLTSRPLKDDTHPVSSRFSAKLQYLALGGGENLHEGPWPPLIQTMGSGVGCVTPFLFRDFPSWNPRWDFRKNFPSSWEFSAQHDMKPRNQEHLTLRIKDSSFFHLKGGLRFLMVDFGWCCSGEFFLEVAKYTPGEKWTMSPKKRPYQRKFHLPTSSFQGDNPFVFFREVIRKNNKMGGGFKYVLCSPLFGEDFHFD